MRSLVRILVEGTLWALMLLLTLMIGLHYGEKRGMAQALKTDPVSEQLEMVCAGLWVGEQNRKHAERSK